MIKTKKAIAAAAMPYGSYVEVGDDGFAVVDPTLSCAGGVVKRPLGPDNNAAAGEELDVVTDGQIAAVVGGQTMMLDLENGRIKGGGTGSSRQGERTYP